MGKHKPDRPNIHIENKSMQLKKDLMNIAKNSGYSTLSDFLRSKLIKLRDEAADYLKLPHKD